MMLFLPITTYHGYIICKIRRAWQRNSQVNQRVISLKTDCSSQDIDTTWQQINIVGSELGKKCSAGESHFSRRQNPRRVPEHTRRAVVLASAEVGPTM